MIRDRAIWGLVGLLLCSLAGGGCDFVFRLDHISPQDAPAGSNDSDGPPADSPAVACATPVLHDTFAGPDICAPWGSGYNDPGAQIVEAGALVLTPSTTAATVAGCTSNVDLPLGTGVMATVDSAITGPDVYTVLQVHGGLEYQIKVGGDGRLHFQTSASQDIGTPITYQPAMRYWRIRPQQPSTLVGEVSLDGQLWIQLGSATVTLQAMVGIELSGGSNTSGASGHAVFTDLLICPVTR